MKKNKQQTRNIPLPDDGDSEFDYEVSESDDEFTDNQKLLLEKSKKRKGDSDSEEDVYRLRSSSDESDDDDNSIGKSSDSDIQDKDDDGDIPDARAWGQKKKDFYNTDYVDQDYGGGFKGKDAQGAMFEEMEAKEIQKRLVEQLQDEDFMLDIFPAKKTENVDDKMEDIQEEVIQTDFSNLSKRQKMDLMKKQSPEFFSLRDDFKDKMAELNFLKPVYNCIKGNKIPKCKGADCVILKYRLILNYCTNISFYFLLKSKGISVQSHPVIKRLFHYRQLLKELEPVYEEKIKPQVEEILDLINNGEDLIPTEPVKKSNSRKLLSIIKNLEAADRNNSKKKLLDSDSEDEGIGNSKKMKLDESPSDLKLVLSSSESEVEDERNTEKEIVSSVVANEGMGEKGNSKRGITYQIAKNKGLTPHRKKEERNPRVKLKLKYRKAKIRRKGQIREVRKGSDMYGGEHSGIKASVIHSVKIK